MIMRTKTSTKTHLDFITSGLANSAIRRGKKRYTQRVTLKERDIFDGLRRLDEDLTRSIVNPEPSPFAREREKRVGEEPTSSPGGVQSPLDGRVKEHGPGRGEGMDPANDAELDPTIVMQHINEYFDEVKPREFLEDIRNWSPGYVKYMGWEDYYDKKTGKVAEFIPDEWPTKK
jgi:hypothetical protein